MAKEKLYLSVHNIRDRDGKLKEYIMSTLGKFNLIHLNKINTKLKEDNQNLQRINATLNKKLNSLMSKDLIEIELNLLTKVKAHSEIASILLPNKDDNFLKLIVIAAQWSNVLRVWDTLATQVKNRQQKISATELEIINHCLYLFNLTLQSNQANFQTPKLCDKYDYDIHQKLSGSGGTIEQVLLPGLYNVAGDLIRTAIVVTE